MKPSDEMAHAEDLNALLRVMGTAALRAGVGYLGNRLGRERVAQIVARRPDSRTAKALMSVFDLSPSPAKRPAPPPPITVPANTNASSKFLDERQLCDELGISPVTATKWRGNAEGPPSSASAASFATRAPRSKAGWSSAPWVHPAAFPRFHVWVLAGS